MRPTLNTKVDRHVDPLSRCADCRLALMAGCRRRAPFKVPGAFDLFGCTRGKTFARLTDLPASDAVRTVKVLKKYSMIRTILAVAFCAAITIFVVSHTRQGSTRPTAAEISAFARDAHIVVGEVPLVLPFIAFFDRSLSLGSTADRERWWQEHEAFRLASSDPATAPELQSVDLYLSVYGWAKDTHVATWQSICPQLSRAWARSSCDDPWAPLLRALPRNMTLADVRKPERFDSWFTIGGEKRSDHIRAMTLLPGVPDIVCDRKWSSDGARYCTAAVRVEKHLMAVWSVGDWGGETAEVKAAREGRVLVGFLRFGLRLDERYPDLKAIACASLRPESVAGLARDENRCDPG